MSRYPSGCNGRKIKLVWTILNIKRSKCTISMDLGPWFRFIPMHFCIVEGYIIHSGIVDIQTNSHLKWLISSQRNTTSFLHPGKKARSMSNILKAWSHSSTAWCDLKCPKKLYIYLLRKQSCYSNDRIGFGADAGVELCRYSTFPIGRKCKTFFLFHSECYKWKEK